MSEAFYQRLTDRSALPKKQTRKPAKTHKAAKKKARCVWLMIIFWLSIPSSFCHSAPRGHSSSLGGFLAVYRSGS
jgi:hypothetical protein